MRSYTVFETFAARPLHYGARKDLFTGLVECGGVILCFLLSKGKKQAHPFTPRHKTGQSDTQKLGKQVGGATSGAVRFQSKQAIPHSDPLRHNLWMQYLCTHI